MSYAVKKDGTGWRAVNSKEDLVEGEEFSTTMPEVFSEFTAEAHIARIDRNKRIVKADIEINILEDAGKDASEWRKYRQALRDVPAQKGFPAKIKWPKEPS